MRSSLLACCLLVLAGPIAAQATNPPAPVPTQPPPPPVTGYGAWFGSIPNMAGDGGGILLDGATTGSPAEKAGLKAGDRLLSIGGVRMEDLRSMVEVLRAAQPGTPSK